MTRYLITSAAMLAGAMLPMLFDADATAAATTEVAKKSIVPAKYGDKYKNGGSDELAEFIKAQCSGKDGFEYTAFFQLCRLNGIADEKVAHYEGQVAAKDHGSQGRARMTLRNMLATFARKNGTLKRLDGTDVAVNIAKPAVSGAAAKAQETAQASAGEADASEGAADSTEADATAPAEEGNDAEV